MEVQIEKTIEERGSRYGDFADNAATSQSLKDIIYNGACAHRLKPHHAEALDNICQKLARIVNGDPTYDDNWRDIIGYATLVMEIDASKPKPAKI